MKEKNWIAQIRFVLLDGRGVLHKMEDKMERLKKLSRLFFLITCLSGLSLAQAQVPDSTNLKGNKEQSIFEYFKKIELARSDSLKKIEQWGEQRTIKLFSKVLNEERSFLVSLPRGYNNSMKKFPVLYRLDGDAEQLYDMYQKTEAMVFKQQAPEMILVSLKNTDRRRDMTPVKTSYCKNPGADKFLKFISAELIPFIDKNYRTSQFRILCGQSQSSVFTMYTLLEQPQLFNGYIAISAYFPGCRDYFIEKANHSFGHKSFENRYFFFTRGAQDDQYNRNGITEQALAKLIDIIKNTNPSGFRYEYKVYPEYGHCPEPSLIDGLKWLKKTVSSDVEYFFNSTHPYISPDESYIVFDVFDNNGISALHFSLAMKHWKDQKRLVFERYWAPPWAKSYCCYQSIKAAVVNPVESLRYE